MTTYPVSASLSILHIVVVSGDQQKLANAMYDLMSIPSDVLRLMQYANHLLSRGVPFVEIKSHCLRPSTHFQQKSLRSACVIMGGEYLQVAPAIEEACFIRETNTPDEQHVA